MKNNLKYLIAILLATTAFAGIDPSNNLKLGDGQASDKKVTFNKGVGAANPLIKWDEATGKLQFCNDGVTCTDFGSGTGGGSSFPPYTSLIDYLNRAENGENMPRVSTQLFDTFNSSKGTLVNASIGTSKLQLNSGSTSGSYTRSRQMSETVTKLAGHVNMAIQAAAPTTDAIVSNQILFTGDLTALFPVNKNIIIYIQQQSDGETVHTYLKTIGGKIAQLPVSAASYNSGTNKTTITVTNAESLDLTMGVAAIDNNTKLRVAPFDYQFKTKTSVAGSYEDLDVEDADTTGNIKLPGESYYAKLFSITGTITSTQAECSSNQTYCIVRLAEKTAGNSLWHFGYTDNGGRTWTDLGTKSAGAALGAEYNSNYYNTPRQIAVANNGKAFWYYFASGGAGIAGKGVYANLASSPVLTDTPATGVATYNINGATAGWIFSHGGEHVLATIDADRADLSYISILGNASGGGGYATYFTNGGATFGVGYTANMPWTWLSMGATFVTGTSGSHRATFLVKNPTDGYTGSYNITEGSITLSSRTLVFGSIDRQLIAFNGDQITGNVYAVTHDLTNLLQYVSGTVTGTPTYSAVKTIANTAGGGLDSYVGMDTPAANNWHKNLFRRLIINPSDSNSFMVSLDYIGPDSKTRNAIYEVRSDTGFQGAHITQYNTNTTNAGIRFSSAFTKVAQTFQADSSRFRTVSLILHQVGKVELGYTLTCSVYATAAGTPTGSALFTAVNTYDPSKLTKGSSGQLVHFNFNTSALTNGTTYAIVLEANYPISASNYILPHSQTGNPYGAGSIYVYDGATWSVNGTEDWRFEINGEWTYDIVTNGVISSSGTAMYPYREDVLASETNFQAIDSSNIQWIARRVPNRSNVSFNPLNGDAMRSVLTVGSGNTASSFSAPTGMGLANHEKYLMFNVSLGNTDNGQRNITTGVVDATKLGEDRSGEGSTTVSYASITYGTGSGFSNGYGNFVAASSQSVNYNHLDSQNIVTGIPFYIEAEMMVNTVSVGEKTILGKYFSGASGGYRLSVNAVLTGDLTFYAYDSGGSLIAETRSTAGFLSAATYTVVRATYDGTTIRLYKSSSPTGTFTEASYAVQTTLTGTVTGTDGMKIGGTGNGMYFDGKIGYVKFANGASTPAYTGYKPQYATTNIQNLGAAGVFAELHAGTAENAINGSYNVAGFLSPAPNEASIVDSYEDIYYFNHTLTSPGTLPFFQINLGRGGNSNPSSVDGYNLFYAK